MSRNGQRKKNVRPAVVKKVLERQAKKERARVAKEVHKLQQLEAGDKNPHIQQLQEQYRQLVDGHNQLVQSYNGYVKSAQSAFGHVDVRVGALMLAFDDFIKGGVENVTRRPPPEDKPDEVTGVYWEAYIKHFIQLMRSVAPEQAEQREDALITPEAATPSPTDDEPDYVFGGDLNNGDQPAPEEPASASI